LATGNFNEQTAHTYCDHSLFTVNQDIVEDVERLFKDLIVNKFNDDYKAIITSPLEMRPKLIQLIDREIKNKKEGHPAYIILKMNSLTDEEIISKLYEASNAGVKIDLIVRGMCCLVPQIPGYSENITARSIVDRYLEHARVWIFCNDGEESTYLSSADFMNRNLDRRVEVAFPIFSPSIKQQIRKLIDLQLIDDTKAREININNDNRYFTSRKAIHHHAQLETYLYYKDKISI